MFQRSRSTRSLARLTLAVAAVALVALPVTVQAMPLWGPVDLDWLVGLWPVGQGTPSGAQAEAPRVHVVADGDESDAGPASDPNGLRSGGEEAPRVELPRRDADGNAPGTLERRR